MKKSILLMAVLIALVSLCLVFASCDSGSSDSGDPTPPPVPAPVTYTIIFDANGGSGTMNSEIVEAGTSYEIPENGFTAPKIPVGAVNEDADIPFVGWNTAADGTGTTYAVEGTIQATDITANITLYAQWANPLFTVADDGAGNVTKVRFSKGNLWYGKVEGATTATFNFEDNQYSFANSWNVNHVSHFRWAAKSSTLADDVESAISTGTLLSGSTTDVFFTNATQTTTRSDFTVNGVSGKWRTLSKVEWDYLLNTRIVNEGQKEGKSYQRATINSDGTGVYGMIIYPDNYTAQTAATSYTSAKWSAMEAAGCVFLPTAGYRNGSSVYSVGSNGYYWSATPYIDNQAYCQYFHSDSAGTNSVNRYSGRSVRLVCGVSEN